MNKMLLIIRWGKSIRMAVCCDHSLTKCEKETEIPPCRVYKGQHFWFFNLSVEYLEVPRKGQEFYYLLKSEKDNVNSHFNTHVFKGSSIYCWGHDREKVKFTGKNYREVAFEMIKKGKRL